MATQSRVSYMTTRGICTLSKGCDPVRAEFSFNGAYPSYVRLVLFFCFPPEIRTPIQWLKTTCPAIRREENIVAISRLELPTGSYPNLAHETSAAPALQYSCGGGNRTHLVQAYETCVCTSSSSPQFIVARTRIELVFLG